MTNTLSHLPKWHVQVELFTTEFSTRAHKAVWMTVLAENESDAAARASTQAHQMYPGFNSYEPAHVMWVPRVVAGRAA